MAMPVPGISDLSLNTTPADLMTDEEKRKKLLAAQQQRLLPSPGASSLMGDAGAGYGSALG